MKRPVFTVCVLPLLVIALCIPALAGEKDGAYRSWSGYTTGEEVLWDATVARPAGIASLIIGAAASIVALPFALASGSTSSMYKSLIGEPWEFTFQRPLGVTDYRYHR